MKVVFLGTAGYYPTEKRHTNCVLLKDLNIILDAGTGFFRFPRYITSDEISIFLSHYHMDHVSGLTQLYGLFKGKKVKIYGSKGIHSFLNTLFNQPFFGAPLSKHPFTVELNEIAEEEFMDNNVKVITRMFTRHSYPVLGYRIEHDNKSITYITDTMVGDDEIDFAKNSDLLIHECYYLNEFREIARKDMHSTAKEVAELAKKANCKKLALYHLNPSLHQRHSDFEREAKSIFPNAFLPKECVEIDV